MPRCGTSGSARRIESFRGADADSVTVIRGSIGASHRQRSGLDPFPRAFNVGFNLPSSTCSVQVGATLERAYKDV